MTLTSDDYAAVWPLLFLSVWACALLLADLFIPKEQSQMPKDVSRAELLQNLASSFQVDLVADVPAPRAIDYFVAARQYPRGVHMELFQLKPLAG